jgi:hypothetical protein
MSRAKVVAVRARIRKEARMRTLLAKIVTQSLMAKQVAAEIDQKTLVLIRCKEKERQRL